MDATKCLPRARLISAIHARKHAAFRSRPGDATHPSVLVLDPKTDTNVLLPLEQQSDEVLGQLWAKFNRSSGAP